MFKKNYSMIFKGLCIIITVALLGGMIIPTPIVSAEEPAGINSPIGLAPAATAAAAAPTDGWTEVSYTYDIQTHFNNGQTSPNSERYEYVDGVHHFWIVAGDHGPNGGGPRSELRFRKGGSYKPDSGKYQFEADIMVMSPTNDESIMQVFGASLNATSLMIRAFDGGVNGLIRRSTGGTIYKNDIYGKWFHLNVIHDTVAHKISIYVDGELMETVNDGGYPSNGEYYFKCGVYGTIRTPKAESFVKNIRIWQKDIVTPSATPAPSSTPIPSSSATPMPIPTASVTLLNENFDSTATGSVPADWTITTRSGDNLTIIPGGTVSVQEFPSATNKSLMINDISPIYNTNAQKTFSAQEEFVIAQYNVSFSATGKTHYIALMGGDTEAIRLRTNGSTIQIQEGSTYKTLQSYIVNKWYTIKVVANVAADRCDVYIDGVNIATNKIFTNAVSFIDSIKVWSNSGNMDYLAYIDDVLIATPASPVLTVPGDVTAEATGDDTFVDIGTASSPEGVVITNDAPEVFPLGTTIVTWTATNIYGKTSTATQKITVVDTTPPKITGAAATQPNANGWYNTDVSVHFSASDTASGVVDITPDTIITTEGAAQSVTGTAKDMAGNSASVVVGNINIDKTKPTISVTSAVYYKTTDALTVNYAVYDNLSGVEYSIATLNGKPVVNGQVISLAAMAGLNTIEITAKDKAGNVSIKSVVFEVIINATVDINPNALNLMSSGGVNSMTAYIELPSGYDISLIGAATVKMNVNGTIIDAQLSPSEIGDYDSNKVKDLMVKFDRQKIINALGRQNGDINIVITGKLSDGKNFSGSDMIKVIR